MEASDVRRMKELGEESAKLKEIYANLAVDNEIPRDLFTKKAELCRQKAVVQRIPDARRKVGFLSKRVRLLIVVSGLESYYSSALCRHPDRPGAAPESHIKNIFNLQTIGKAIDFAGKRLGLFWLFSPRCSFSYFPIICWGFSQ